MDTVTIGIIGLAILFIFLAIGVPVGTGMAIVGFLGLFYLVSGSAAIAKLIIVPFGIVSNYEWCVLPLFLLMAEVVFVSNMGSDLFNLSRKWLARLPGGLAIATIAGCAAFGAVTASSVASTATMGLVAKPEMDKYNYHPQLSTGCIAAGSSLSSLIPPSGVLIIYGILTQTSIGKLFIAGIIPGILEALFYIVTIFIICRFNPSFGPRAESTTLKEKILAFKDSGEIIALMVFVIAGLLIGLFTPTEAGAVGCGGAIVASLFRRRLDSSKFKTAILETLKTTGMIYGILIGAFILNNFISVTRIPTYLADFTSRLSLPSLGILIAIMFIYLFLGCFLDAAAMQVLTVPIFFPLIIALGINPIWFGILMTRAMEIAMITPPVGMNVYVMSAAAPDVPMQTIFKGIIPFLIADILNVLVLIFVPSLVLFLPNMMM